MADELAGVLVDPAENPRAVAAASGTRSVRLVPLHACCALCAKSGHTRAVQLLPGGAPSGLCAWHNEYERQLREVLREDAEAGRKLDKKALDQAKARVVARMKGQAA
jgi:hypothetical protein